MKKKNRTEKDILLSLSFTKSKEWKPVYKRAIELYDEKFETKVNELVTYCKSKGVSTKNLIYPLRKDYVDLIFKIRKDYLFLQNYLNKKFSGLKDISKIKINPIEFYSDKKLISLMEESFLSASLRFVVEVIQWKRNHPGRRAKRPQELFTLIKSEKSKNPGKDYFSIIDDIVIDKFPELLTDKNGNRLINELRIKKINSIRSQYLRENKARHS